jgi:hypothetical protein
MDVHVRFERKTPAIPAGKPVEKLHDQPAISLRAEGSRFNEQRAA